LLEGKRTLPVYLPGTIDQRLSLKKLLDDPPAQLVWEAFLSNLPKKYFSTEKEVETDVFSQVLRIFSDPAAVANPLSYALYFN
jgi:hypothetical protein